MVVDIVHPTAIEIRWVAGYGLHINSSLEICQLGTHQFSESYQSRPVLGRLLDDVERLLSSRCLV